MRGLSAFVLYAALSLGATAATAADLEALKQGDMKKLVLIAAPQPVPDLPFTDATGAERRLSDWRGKVVLVNFWALWCPPCRAEMPALDRLQATLGGERFAVVTIATGRNGLPAIDRFFAETGVTHLPVLRDETQALSRAMGVLGLPVSVIVDAEGHEIGRLTGEAEWDGDSAQAILDALIAEVSSQP